MPKEINKFALTPTDAILFQYEGAVNKEILLDTLAKIETILDKLGAGRQSKRKIVNIAIEALQNLQLHSFTLAGSEYNTNPIFILAKENEFYTITIGNLISVAEQPVLEDKLKKINSLNEEEIKFLYAVIMKQTVVKFSTKGGAGLGLIDMKKKSGNPLEFSFQKVDDTVSYFSLKISVSD